MGTMLILFDLPLAPFCGRIVAHLVEQGWGLLGVAAYALLYTAMLFGFAYFSARSSPVSWDDPWTAWILAPWEDRKGGAMFRSIFKYLFAWWIFKRIVESENEIWRGWE